jgi:hypothetical protein
MSIRFVALDSAIVETLRHGGPDANGQVPEFAVSNGSGVPCRHCLAQVASGERYLILAHRPFPEPQPYAELGPIFLHADGCPRGGGAQTPPMLASAHYIVRGYSDRHRIVYGTGRIAETPSIAQAATEILADPAIAYVHVRSASNNCYQCRIDRT